MFLSIPTQVVADEMSAIEGRIYYQKVMTYDKAKEDAMFSGTLGIISLFEVDFFVGISLGQEDYILKIEFWRVFNDTYALEPIWDFDLRVWMWTDDPDDFDGDADSEGFYDLTIVKDPTHYDDYSAFDLMAVNSSDVNSYLNNLDFSATDLTPEVTGNTLKLLADEADNIDLNENASLSITYDAYGVCIEYLVENEASETVYKASSIGKPSSSDDDDDDDNGDDIELSVMAWIVIGSVGAGVVGVVVVVYTTKKRKRESFA